MMAADNLGTSMSFIDYARAHSERCPASYGSLARFKDVQRLQAVGDYTVIGASGDMSDFQYIQRLLDDIAVGEFAAQDGHELGPVETHEFLSQVMYGRRSKLNPLWNSLIIGGFKDGKRCVVTPHVFLEGPMYHLMQVLVVCRFVGDDIYGFNDRHRVRGLHRTTTTSQGRRGL